MSVLHARQKYISIYKVKWRTVPVKCLPKSPDLTSMNFSFVGFYEGQGLLPLPTTQHELKIRIRKASALTENEFLHNLRRVVDVHRFGNIVATCGAHTKLC